jgi:pimeloyl-ACP methyl ester carboxylesterase
VKARANRDRLRGLRAQSAAPAAALGHRRRRRLRAARRAPWLRLSLGVLALTAAAGLFPGAVSAADEYRFPIADPLRSSLLPAGYHPLRSDYALSFLEIRPDRRSVPLLEGKHKIILAVFAQRVPAPLVFVIPGVGGYALTEAALMLAEQLHDMGFHTVTLPDPLSWQYALGVSESTLPGYLPQDGREYYGFLKRVVEHLQAEHHLGITGYSVAGYSFGGLLTAFLARVDREERAFGFERAVLISPAIDLRHAIGVVDGFFASGRAIPETRKSEVSSAMVDVVIKLKNRALTPELVTWAVAQWRFGPHEMQWLIGQSFRGATQGTILASQQIAELRAPDPRAAPGRRSRVNEARRFSFGDYLSQFVFPAIRRSAGGGLTDDQLLAQTSLAALAPELRDNPRLFVMQNVDDFLARAEDIDALRAWLGDRLYLYPVGGHLGNLWFEKNRVDLRGIMAPVAGAR